MTAPEELLARVAQEVLEAVAFMTLLPADAELEPAPASSFVTAEVRFTGPFDGALQVAACPDLRRGLATSMLGLLNAAPTSLEQRDALRELANIVCGNLLPALSGGQAEFRLSAPELSAGFTPRPDAPSASLALEGGRVELALVLRAGATAAGPGEGAGA